MFVDFYENEMMRLNLKYQLNGTIFGHLCHLKERGWRVSSQTHQILKSCHKMTF